MPGMWWLVTLHLLSKNCDFPYSKSEQLNDSCQWVHSRVEHAQRGHSPRGTAIVMQPSVSEQRHKSRHGQCTTKATRRTWSSAAWSYAVGPFSPWLCWAWLSHWGRQSQVSSNFRVTHTPCLEAYKRPMAMTMKNINCPRSFPLVSFLWSCVPL